MATDPIARPATAGTVELVHHSTHGAAGAENGCGNDAPLEITERFPQPLGNLAENGRFPHSHSRLSCFDQKNNDTDPSAVPCRAPKEVLDSRPGCEDTYRRV